jgi:molybdate transport system substrate-binding protein
MASTPIALTHCRMKYARLATTPVALCLACTSCRAVDSAAPVRVAVAVSFSAAHAEIIRGFELENGLQVETSLGATGQLYAQIQNGAPYDVFLAADTVRPARLESEGLAVARSRFTYAVGRLAMLAPRWDSVRSADLELMARTFRHLAIANPRTAPQGAAAQWTY